MSLPLATVSIQSQHTGITSIRYLFFNYYFILLASSLLGTIEKTFDEN